ncbi:MAG: hypothetical protein PWQ56_141 [Patescibacteria group bacterium]|nr:hypothetical protein [Patescibacteria group bacterium]
MEKKQKAIILRKRGLSYSEILREVPVAKSTLSLWLRDVGLAKKQQQRITNKRILSARKGAEKRRNQRIEITKEIKNSSRKDIKEINEKDLWLIGISLHWAEGAKEKNGNSSGIIFSNSDLRMILIFIKWIESVFKIKKSELVYELYIHETANIKNAQNYWSKNISIPLNNIRTYLKKSKINTIRKNSDDDYYGLIRVRIKKSTNLNRMIDGWVDGVCEKLL